MNRYIIAFSGSLDELASLGMSYTVVETSDGFYKALLLNEEDYWRYAAGVMSIDQLVQKYTDPTTLEILHTEATKLVNDYPLISYTRNR